jgi:hypothetical protein
MDPYELVKNLFILCTLLFSFGLIFTIAGNVQKRKRMMYTGIAMLSFMGLILTFCMAIVVYDTSL